MRKSITHDFVDKFSNGIMINLTTNEEKCVYHVLCLQEYAEDTSEVRSFSPIYPSFWFFRPVKFALLDSPHQGGVNYAPSTL